MAEAEREKRLRATADRPAVLAGAAGSRPCQLRGTITRPTVHRSRPPSRPPRATETGAPRRPCRRGIAIDESHVRPHVPASVAYGAQMVGDDHALSRQLAQILGLPRELCP